MKLNSLLTVALIPMGLMAAPVADEGASDIEAREPDVSVNEPDSLLKRTTTMCQIVGADLVNCRAGPGTNYKIVQQFPRGIRPIFSCVKSGECITVNGAVNWSVPHPLVNTTHLMLTALASPQRLGLVTS
jgi:hypothetical protein